MFAQSQKCESHAKYNLDAVTQETVHYPDNNNILLMPNIRPTIIIFNAEPDEQQSESLITRRNKTEHVLLV